MQASARLAMTVRDSQAWRRTNSISGMPMMSSSDPSTRALFPRRPHLIALYRPMARLHRPENARVRACSRLAWSLCCAGRKWLRKPWDIGNTTLSKSGACCAELDPELRTYSKSRELEKNKAKVAEEAEFTSGK